MLDTNVQISDMRHRMANDLALIVGVLERQRRLTTTSAGDVIDSAINSLLAVSLYYRRLYEQPATADLIDLPKHLGALADAMRDSYLDPLNIRIECCVAAATVSHQAARDIGRIVVELIANAAKHAFGDKGGRVSVIVHNTGDSILCIVADDGCGLDQAMAGRGASGLLIASQIAASLGGRLDLRCRSGERGGAFELTIPGRFLGRQKLTPTIHTKLDSVQRSGSTPSEPASFM